MPPIDPDLNLTDKTRPPYPPALPPGGYAARDAATGPRVHIVWVGVSSGCPSVSADSGYLVPAGIPGGVMLRASKRSVFPIDAATGWCTTRAMFVLPVDDRAADRVVAAIRRASDDRVAARRAEDAALRRLACEYLAAATPDQIAGVVPEDVLDAIGRGLTPHVPAGPGGPPR